MSHNFLNQHWLGFKAGRARASLGSRSWPIYWFVCLNRHIFWDHTLVLFQSACSYLLSAKKNSSWGSRTWHPQYRNMRDIYNPAPAGKHNLIGGCKIIMLTNNRERARKRIPPIPAIRHLYTVYWVQPTEPSAFSASLADTVWSLGGPQPNLRQRLIKMDVNELSCNVSLAVWNEGRFHSDKESLSSGTWTQRLLAVRKPRPSRKSYADSRFAIIVSHQ